MTRGLVLSHSRLHPVPAQFDVLIAANRATAYGAVSRWLLHDLRNPTQALTLITELMGGPGGMDPDLLKTINESTAHLARSLELLDRVLRAPRPAWHRSP